MYPMSGILAGNCRCHGRRRPRSEKAHPQLPLASKSLPAPIEALGAALASGADFIRAEAFVFGHVADEGYMDASAGPLLRYRKTIGAEKIAIFTDIKKTLPPMLSPATWISQTPTRRNSSCLMA